MSPPPRFAARTEREAYGRGLRDRVRRTAQDRWVTEERDVLARLVASEAGRLPQLLPVRHGRMASSPFAFLRGGAAIMAPDLIALPHTGYLVQICGDAHVRNLGAYAAPDGTIVFDLNDFDETCRAPWEWDLRRLAISLVLVARESGTADAHARDAVAAMVRTYRELLDELCGLPAVDVARYAPHRFAGDGAVGRVLARAERLSSHQARDHLTAPGPDGLPRFVADPPRLTRVPDGEAAAVLAALVDYRATIAPDRQQVLACYAPYDVAFKVAGTGSIGAHNYAVLCRGNGPDDALVLQVKEALPTAYVAAGWADPGAPAHDGQRVAEGAHRLQTACDPFIGWTTIAGRPYYVRQLADHQASIDPADLRRAALVEYARVCGEAFAKAHARTADPAVLYGYAGAADKLDRALARLALLGADQVTRDWELLVDAIRRGALATEDLD